MVKKLRRNFMIATMVSVIVVLVLFVGIMNAANFISSDNDADSLLRLLTENGGSFDRAIASMKAEMQPPEPKGGDTPPAKPDGSDPTAKPDDDRDDEEDYDDEDDDDMQPPPDKPSDKPDNMRNDFFRRDDRMGKQLLTEETPYETRYFTVELKNTGEPCSIDTGKIAAVTGDDALAMAQELLYAHKDTGYYGTYKYLAKETENGVLYVFIDRNRALSSVREFMMISLLVSLGAAAAIFVLAFVFSGIAVKPIAESYEKQKKFITNAGHELKTPLAVINSCTEVIELEQGESKWTQGIATQTERLTQLTKELVDLARMDEGGARLVMEEFSLSEAAEEILDPFELMAEQKGIDFHCDIRPGISYKGDRNAIARLCSIMADNAVKYTPESGSIEFSLYPKGKRVILMSRNTAENITKGSHPELFDRFTRGDTSRSGDKPGYGIGLSMAQSIVSAHGGKIEAFSEDGKSLCIRAKL